MLVLDLPLAALLWTVDGDQRVLALDDFPAGKPLIAFNATACLTLLARGGHGANVIGDPMLMAYVLDPTQPLDLQSLARRYLGLDLTSDFPEPLEAGILRDVPGALPVDRPGQLLAIAATIGRLHEKLRDLPAWATPVYGQELKLAPVIADMHLRGISVSRPILVDTINRLQDHAAQTEASLNVLVDKLP